MLTFLFAAPGGIFQPIKSNNVEHKFKDGCMWEGGGFSIHIDEQCSENGGGEMCKHCHSKEIKGYKVTWICPRVVVALNEGGCNSTGVCLDCILEAAKSLYK